MTELELAKKLNIAREELVKKLDEYLAEHGDEAARDPKQKFLLKEPGEPYLVSELITRSGNEYMVHDIFLPTMEQTLRA